MGGTRLLSLNVRGQMRIKTALDRDYCPNCGNLFPSPVPDSQTLRGGLLGSTFYRCRSCNSFSRYTFRWRSACWSLPVSAGALLLLVWAARRISALIPFRDIHPGWYEAMLGLFAGCVIAPCFLIALRTSFRLSSVPQSSVPTSKLQPTAWRLIDYSVLSVVGFGYAFYKDHLGLIFGTVIGLTIYEIWHQVRSRRTVRMSSN